MSIYMYVCMYVCTYVYRNVFVPILIESCICVLRLILEMAVSYTLRIIPPMCYMRYDQQPPHYLQKYRNGPYKQSPKEIEKAVSL